MDQQFVSQLEQLLNAVLQPSNGSLKEATKTLQTQFYTQPAALPALLHILQSGSNDGLKQLAGVEARKLVPTQWTSIDAGVQAEIKTSLLSSAFSEPTEIVRHANARVIAAIGGEELDEKKWPELVPSLIQAASGNDSKITETAVFILLSLLDNMSPELNLYISDFLNLFSVTMGEGASLESRSLSAQALNQVSNLIEEEGEINPEYAAKFAALIPAVVNVLEAVIKADDTTNTKLIFNKDWLS